MTRRPGTSAAARLVSAVACGAVLAAPVLVAPTASAVGEPYTVTVQAVTVTDGPADDHTTVLDTALYVPDGVGPADPAPALLMTHGFGLTKDSPEVTNYADFFARQGYVVATYTSSGFGASSGCIQLDSKDWDAKDASGVIDELLDGNPAVLSDSTGPVVGMVGGSYGGGVTLNVAEQDDRVRAIAPGRTWNSLTYALNPNNYVRPGADRLDHQGADQGVFKTGWTALFFALGNAQPAMGNGGCAQDKLTGDPADAAGLACPGYYLAVCEINARILATGDASDADKALLARSAGAVGIEDLTVPTLLVQGQSDTLFNLNDAAATYTSLRDADVPVHMIWNSGGHGGYTSAPGEGETYDGQPHTPGEEHLPLQTLAFFDHYLLGTGAPPAGFSYFADWLPYAGSGPNDEQYLAAPSFPLAPSTTFTLGADSTLALPGAVAPAGELTFVNPPNGTPAAFTEVSNFTGPGQPAADSPPTEQPGQNVSFTSAAFPTDVDAVGIPTASLDLSHANGQDLVFFGKVFDVAPDGSAELIHRLIAPVRVPADEVDAGSVEINLLGFAHRFAAGHSVRLTLASTDSTSRNATVADVITLTAGPGSTFTLPGAVAAAAPAAPGSGPAGPGTVEPVTGGPAAAAPGGAPAVLATTGGAAVLPLVALVLLGLGAAVRARGRREV